VAVDAPAFALLGDASSTPVGGWAQVLAAADLTGDGRSDAAIATARYFDEENDEQLHLFTRQSDTLTRTQRLAAGENPESIVAADLNHDQRSDIALAVAGDSTIRLYTQNPDQGLTEAAVLPLPGAPNALAAGDFTGDLYDDLAAVAPLSGTIALWQSSAEGLKPLSNALTYPTGGFDALAVGDLDNDGDDDIAALRGAGYLQDELIIYEQHANAFPITDTRSLETGGFLPHSIAVGDINSDGLDDLVVTAGGNEPDAYLNVFLQGSSGLATTPTTYEAYNTPGPVAVGDINHDGREDVVALHDAWRTLSVYTQTISGELAPYAVADIPYSDRYRPQALTLADMDGNGGLDVALVDRDHGLTVLTNTLTAPTTTIEQPAHATIVSTEMITVSGMASANAVRVEVRLRGETDWIAATLTAEGWQAVLSMPRQSQALWIESRAVDEQGYIQAPVAQQRIWGEGQPTLYLPLVLR
jgi:hypothetical protein